MGLISLQKIVLVGAGGHSKILIDIIKHSYEIVGMTDVDQAKHGGKFYGVDVLGNDDLLIDIYSKGIRNALVSIGSVGSCSLREKVCAYVKAIGFDMVNAISKNTIISDSVAMGYGNAIMDCAIIHADTTIGNNVIINTGSVIEHDCIIEDFVHIAPRAVISGGVFIGRGTHIGVGASVIQGISIEKNCIIGSGAVVVRDIPDNSLCVGVPAKIIKQLKE